MFLQRLMGILINTKYQSNQDVKSWPVKGNVSKMYYVYLSCLARPSGVPNLLMPFSILYHCSFLSVRHLSYESSLAGSLGYLMSINHVTAYSCALLTHELWKTASRFGASNTKALEALAGKGRASKIQKGTRTSEQSSLQVHGNS